MNDITDKLKEIFIIYIIVLLHLEIINEHDAVKIYYGFYKSEFNLFTDKNFLVQISKILKAMKYNILVKYINFIYIIGLLDNKYYEIIKLYNKSKLSKENKVEITYNDIILCNVSNSYDIYEVSEYIFDNIITYLESFDRSSNFKYFLFTKDNTNIHKTELISRLQLLNKIIGEHLLYLLVNKQNRKYTYHTNILIHTKESADMLTYSELYYYSQSIINKIKENIEDYNKDIEFLKYLKIIVLCYIDDYVDKTTQKFYEKLVKKYIMI